MNVDKKQFLLCAFSLISTTCITAQVKNVCMDSLNYKIVQTRWNKEIEKIKPGTWKLIYKPNLNFKEDSILVTQSLDGGSLYFVGTVLKGGCVKRVSIITKRDPNVAYASIVAWIKLIKVFNPELLPKERNQMLEDLKITDKIFLQNSSIIRGNNTYLFEQTLSGNTFSVLTKN